MSIISIEHEQNEEGGRFVAFVDGQEAGFTRYKWLSNGNFNANGTLVQEEFRSHKLGKPLYESLIQLAREKQVKIYPTCPFIVKSMARDTDSHDLYADDYLPNE